jgi:hypothetical protein
VDEDGREKDDLATFNGFNVPTNFAHSTCPRTWCRSFRCCYWLEISLILIDLGTFIFFGAAIKSITESFRFGDRFGYLVRCPTWFYSDRVARTHQISEEIIHFGYLLLLLFR